LITFSAKIKQKQENFQSPDAKRLACVLLFAYKSGSQKSAKKQISLLKPCRFVAPRFVAPLLSPIALS